MATQYLAFDLGASSGRAVLGTLSDGIMKMEEIHRFNTPMIDDKGHLFWDIERLWSDLVTGLENTIQASTNLRSVSVDSWAVDYVRLDVNGNALANPFAYRDKRLDGVMESAFDIVPRDEIYNITGIQFLPFNSLYQVIADKRAAAASESENHIESQTACRLCIADYFNNRLIGGAIATATVDESMASTTQMMDVHSKQWSTDLMAKFGVNDGTWPRIVPPGTKVGDVVSNKDIAVVATCSHDTGAAVAATPASGEKPWAYVSCGTWSLFGVELKEPMVSAESLAAGFTNEAGVDGTIRFLKNLTGFWILQECTRVWAEEDGAEVNVGNLMDEAAVARFKRKAGAPRHIDMQDGRFLGRSNMPLTLRTYFDETGMTQPASRGEIVRLIVESMAESYRRTIAEVQHLTGETIETLHLFGGGSQSELLCQLTADACGIRVVAGPTEATALGNLLVQARAMGDLAPGDTIRDVAIRSSQLASYQPRRQN